MPKFIGRVIPGSSPLSATQNAAKMVRITYAQAVKLLPSDVFYTVDTSDKGGPRRMAKRWNRWYASPSAIRVCPRATPNMLARAS